jgi:hypothetical protein
MLEGMRVSMAAHHLSSTGVSVAGSPPGGPKRSTRASPKQRTWGRALGLRSWGEGMERGVRVGFRWPLLYVKEGLDNRLCGASCSRQRTEDGQPSHPLPSLPPPAARKAARPGPVRAWAGRSKTVLHRASRIRQLTRNCCKTLMGSSSHLL